MKNWYLWLVYKLQKRFNKKEAKIKDLIKKKSPATLQAYKIDLLEYKKTESSEKEFNYFKFYYNDLICELKNDTLKFKNIY